jgi:hypothetical protein
MLAAPLALAAMVVAVGGETRSPDLEPAAAAAIASGEKTLLETLAARYESLPAETRAKLAFKVRPGEAEFSFRGELRGDQFSPDMLEYVIAGEGKEYETLLTVDAVELRRLKALGPYFAKHAGAGRGKYWSAQLLWVDGKEISSLQLADMLVRIGAKERARFLDEIGVNEQGLGGTTNLDVGRGALPARRLPAKVVLTLRLAGRD